MENLETYKKLVLDRETNHVVEEEMYLKYSVL